MYKRPVVDTVSSCYNNCIKIISQKLSLWRCGQRSDKRKHLKNSTLCYGFNDGGKLRQKRSKLGRGGSAVIHAGDMLPALRDSLDSLSFATWLPQDTSCLAANK